MNDCSIIVYNDAAHRQAVVALWQEVFGYEGAHNRPALAIDKKLGVNDELFFVALVGGSVAGTIMAGYDGHRGWIYSVAVLVAHRRRGLGTQLVKHAEQALSARGCMKINLQIMPPNTAVTAFYAGLGYAVEQRVNMGRRLPENIPGE